jgi:hypothetical protein
MEEEPPIALQRVFGDSVLIRILDFLTLAKDFDYCKSEIAEHAGVDPTSVTRIWPLLESSGIVRKTRTIQHATLYNLNQDSPIARKLTELSDAIAAHYSGMVPEKKGHLISYHR